MYYTENYVSCLHNAVTGLVYSYSTFLSVN